MPFAPRLSLKLLHALLLVHLGDVNVLLSHEEVMQLAVFQRLLFVFLSFSKVGRLAISILCLNYSIIWVFVLRHQVLIICVRLV